jgi:hypothetical protein
MNFSHICIGGGITGIETTIKLVENFYKQYKNNKLKKLSIAIVDKNPGNIPGGVAYGFKSSKFGYFNNPIRLSPKSFQDWLTIKKNKFKIIKYLNQNGGDTGKKWIKKNKKKLFSNNKKEQEELYVPRAISNIWMEEKLITMLDKIKKNKINCEIFFFRGEIVSIQNDKNSYKKIFFKKNICKELYLKVKKNSLKQINFVEGKNLKYIKSITQSVGLGLPPPKQLADKNVLNNRNYIWDFYVEGSTNRLLKLISAHPNKKMTVVYFIGYKAGLLEALTELEQFIFRTGKNINLICSSKNLVSIQKAEMSKDKKKLNLSFFIKKNLKKIKSAKQIEKYLINEFTLALQKGFNKYDVWTNILKQNILDKCLLNLSSRQKNLYNTIYHTKIRNLTRFTYPETINARENLFKKKILVSSKERVKKVSKKGTKLIVNVSDSFNKKKNYICDIVVNVSGPLNVGELRHEIPLINVLKKNGGKVSSGAFLVNNNFEIKGLKNIFTPGILAKGFNPERKTIFKAILKNSILVGKNVAKVLLKEKNF